MQHRASAWFDATHKRVRSKRIALYKFLIVALIAPIFTTVVAPLPAQAAASTTTAPQDVTATANGTTLNVAWGAPAYGANAVTAYQVDYSTDGATWTTSSSSIAAGTFTYGITGLTSGTSYYVRVAAKMGSSASPWAYPWTKLYGTVTPTRSGNNIVYEPGYGLSTYGNQASNVYSAANFTRVRYKMQYVSNSGAKFNYASADFSKWNAISGNKLYNGTTYTSPAATISSLAFPDSTNISLQNPIQAPAADMTVESSDPSLNANNVTGRLEIWGTDYSPQNGWSGGNDGSGTTFDYNDAPNTLSTLGHGSFQVHNVTDAKTILAWDGHGYAQPSIGIGNSPTNCDTTPATDWTFCGSYSSSANSYYNTANRDAWKLETFINVPTKMGSYGLLMRYDAKQYASYSGSGTAWNDISGNGNHATLNNSLTTSSVSNGTFNMNSMQFNGTNQYATVPGNFNYDFTSGFSASFYANFGNASNWERIIDFGDSDANKNIVISRRATSQDLWVELFNNGPTAQNLGYCQATSAIDNNTWTHWSIVLNGSTCAIYKNGDYWSGTTTTYVRSSGVTTNGTGGAVAFTPLPQNTTRSNLYIGRSNWVADNYFEGGIADLAIYNRALSKGEVINMMTDQKASTVYSNASTGECATRVANPGNVTVTTVANDCLIKFSAPSNTTTANKWIVPANVSAARVLTIGGGGGGGAHVGGGGGAGGFLDTTTAFGPNSVISISTGAGGAGGSRVGSAATVVPSIGANSTFGTFTTFGGGGGGTWDNYPNTRDGGSGGGGSAYGGTFTSGGSALVAGQGNSGGSGLGCGSTYGYPTGGGGGAATVGQDPYCPTYSAGRSGDGGIGKQSDITGTSTYYAGGGGGGAHNTSASYTVFVGNGGLGGGGNGATNVAGTISSCSWQGTVTASNGADGFGGGGGGAGACATAGSNSYGGRGGSGVVFVRYGTTTLSISANNGTGYTGATTFSGSTYSYVTLPVQSGATRSGYYFAGWNTSANGNGTNYSAGTLFQLLGTQTLYAQWNSTISYNANGPTISRVIETTTATGSGASTTLNSGSALTGGMVTTGLDLYLDASNSRSYSGTGNIWYDISGNGRNATAVGSPTYDSTNGAFNFNGTSQYFDLGNTSLNYQGTQPYTFGAWVKSSNAAKGEQCIICRYNVGGSFLFRLINGQVESYRTGQGSYQYTGLTLTSGTYYYLASTYDGTNINIFVNGVRVYSSTSGSMSFTSTINTYIGKSVENYDRYFSGQMKVVQAYNIALTDGQVLQNYNALINKSYEAELPTTPGSKAGYTLTGWAATSDTAAVVSSGTYATGLNALPTPYIRLKASDYDGTNWSPTNYVGAGISYINSTRPTLRTNQTGWGTSASFSSVYGTSGNPIKLGNVELSNYTFCAMAKWPVSGVSLPATSGRMFTGTNVNWLDGWYYANVGDTHHTAWNYDGTYTDYNWHYYCDTGNDIYLDGTKLPSTYRSYVTLPTLSIGGGYWNGSAWSDYVDYEFSELVIYDRVLSSDQLAFINRYFKNTYGFEYGSSDAPSASLIPSGSYSSSGTSTLYAVWGSTITYDANGASIGNAPATQIFQRSSGTLATNSGNLAKKGFYFTGWNTKADGTGTFYAAGASYTGPDVTLYAVFKAPVKIQSTIAGADPITLAPYMRFKASDYNSTQKIWYDSSGNGRDTSYIKGAPSITTTTVNQNGSTKSFQTMTGDSTAGVQFKNPTFADSQWTIFSVARYTGTQSSGSARIFDGESGNLLFGFYGNSSGVMHSGGWVTSNSGDWTATSASNTFGQNWVISTGQTDFYKGYGYNKAGTAATSITGTGDGGTNTFAGLTINAGQYVASDYSSAWAVAEVIMFDRKLSASEMQQVQDYLAATYGIQGYTNQANYLAPASTTTALGSLKVSDTATALLGYNNTFSVSPTIPGITLNTSGNTASLTMASTLALGTYYETITVTDASGNTATVPYQLTVVDPLLWNGSNPTSIITTFGKTTRTRLNLAGGYGTRVAAMTHQTSPAPRGISIDTSTIALGYITLITDTGTAVGTYLESITVTDSTNALRVALVTITINAPPIVGYSPSTDAEYPLVTSGLFVNYDFSNTNSYSGTGTSITDLKGNALSGSLSSANLLSPAAGGALSLNGTNKATIQYAPLSNTQSFSKFLWFYPTSATGAIIDVCDNSGCGSYHESEFELFSNVLYARVWNATSVNSGTNTVSLNQWHYIGYSWEYINSTSTVLRIYLDGKVVGSAAQSNGRSAPAAQFDIISQGDTTLMATSTGGTFLFGGYQVYKSILTATQVQQNFQNSKTRYLSLSAASPTYSGALAAAMTEGKSATYSVFAETLGTGANTYSLSGSNSTFSISETNSERTSVTVSAAATATNLTTAKTYYETLTATDSASAATAYYLAITVNPKIAITATLDTITTTFGKAVLDTFTTVSGTGTGNIAFTRTSSSGSSAITHTSVVGSPATAVLTIGSTLPVGTYYETFTATDAAGATTMKVIQIVVNPALTLTSATGINTLETTYSKASSLNINVANGTGTRTASTLPVSVSGVSLTTTNLQTGTIVLALTSAVAVGTYTETLTVTDSSSVSASLVITIIVNSAPTITYAGAASGAINFATTQGGSLQSGTFTAANGTGTRSLTLSGLNSAISIDTSSANAAVLTFGAGLTSIDSTTARTIYETLTVTDSLSVTAMRAMTIVVNPPIIETATSTSIATTSGVETTTVIYATRGSSNKTFAIQGATPAGITITSGTNQATLKVLSTINPGTYNVTVAASDTAGATSTLVISIYVAPPPSMVGPSRIESTQGVLFKSSIYSISGGTGTLTMSVTNSPVNANISLTGVTSSGGFLQVGTASATGTFTSTVRVTDARGSYSEIAVTVVVNAPVTLTGSLAINKIYGTATTNGYSTNGTGTAPFAFSSSPVCAVVKTVSGSYTYEKINGTDSCTWTAPLGVSAVDALLVGAGGGGGGDGGSGGGGGSINTLSTVSLPANRQLTVQVGTAGTGGVWGGSGATSGGTTSLVSGSTTYTAPGGSAGGGCGSAASAGGAVGAGGTPTAGGAGGYGSSGACNAGTGGAGSAGPSSTFTGSAVNYGGGGAGGPFPGAELSVGGSTGGAGGGGTSAISKGNGAYGLPTYFRYIGTTPNGASSRNSFTNTDANFCGAVTGNINYGTDTDFPCGSTQRDNFQGYATGYFVAPASGTITFCLYSDDSSYVEVTAGGSTRTVSKTGASTSWQCETSPYTGYTQGQAYPISVYFTEITGGAAWKLGYTYGANGSTTSPIIVPISQLRSNSEGLAQYFNYVGSTPAIATSKTVLTSSSSGCMERVGNINYSTDAEFPCTSTQQDNFQGYATGYFVAPYTGDITFYLDSDDSSDLQITVNGVTRELQLSIGTASATYSGFVQGQYYPMNVYFTEIGGAAVWKLSYSYGSQTKIAIPNTYLRSTADFTNPTSGTNGLGGGGGAGAAGLFKVNGAQGGSGTVIIKYLTQSDTATETMITSVVNQETPSGLLTLNVPAYVTVGTYTQTIKVQDAANSAPYSATVTITISKATPTTRLSLPGGATTAQYGTPVSLSVTASTPGNIAFKKAGTAISGCSSVTTSSGVATCTWTPTAVETATITALLSPSDSTNYNNSIETASAISVVVGKADTLTVTAGNLSAAYSELSGSANTTIPNRTFTLSGLATAAGDSITAVTYNFAGTINGGSSYASSTTAPKQAGTYSITPSAPVFSSGLLSNYSAVVYAAGTLTINRAVRGSWAPSYNGATNVTTYGAGKTETATVSYLGDGTGAFTTSSPACSVGASNGTITTVGVGSCSITAVLPQTNNWLSETKTVTVTINRGIRTATITPVLSVLKYGDTTTVTTSVSPALDSATVTYSTNGTLGCSIDNVTGLVTGIKALTACLVKVNYDQTSLYESATATSSITINKATAPIVTTDSITSVSYTGSTAIVSPTYSVTGILARDIAQILPLADVSTTAAINVIAAGSYSTVAGYMYSGSGSGWNYAETTTVPSLGGTYATTPYGISLLNGVDIANYDTPTYRSSNLVILPIAQAILKIAIAIQESITVPYDVVVEGGTSTGVLSLQIVSGGTASGCSVSSLRLTSTTAGTCKLTATRAADRNYLAVTSDTVTVSILNFVQNIVDIFNGASGITINHEVPLTVGPVVCSTNCVPTITAIYDQLTSSTTAITRGMTIIIQGTNFNTTTEVVFQRRFSAGVGSFQINSDTELAVAVPMTLRNVTPVEIWVVASGGDSATWTGITVINP